MPVILFSLLIIATGLEIYSAWSLDREMKKLVERSYFNLI